MIEDGAVKHRAFKIAFKVEYKPFSYYKPGSAKPMGWVRRPLATAPGIAEYKTVDPQHRTLQPKRSALLNKSGQAKKNAKVTLNLKLEVAPIKSHKEEDEVWNKDLGYFNAGIAYCEACEAPTGKNEAAFYPLDKPRLARGRFYCKACEPCQNY